MQEPMPVLTTVRVPLELVLRNLIGNAIKHHDRPDGHVHVNAQAIARSEVPAETNQAGDLIEFTIADDGPGIDPAFHERIFQMFQTLQPRDLVEGSGMGLAIVKRMVESHGGTIRVESVLGGGARFKFTWPR